MSLKSRIFKLYLGSDVAIKGVGKLKLIGLNIDTDIISIVAPNGEGAVLGIDTLAYEPKLILKHIHTLTDEQLAELGKLIWPDVNDVAWYVQHMSNVLKSPSIPHTIADKMREWSIAIPFEGVDITAYDFITIEN